MTSQDPLKKLASIDLNLLTVLHAILETGSTQGAADRLGRTQSAASHALGRLRRMFGDPLFVRHGPKLTPTPLALQLHYPLTRILHDTVSLISHGTRFDPSVTSRRIILAAADNCLSASLAVTKALTRGAPGVSVELTSTRRGTSRLLNGEVDLLLSLYKSDFPSGVSTSALPNVPWSVLAAADHPIPDAPTPQDWAAFAHVQVGTGPDGRNPVGDAARIAGVTRQVKLKVNSFLEALNVVAETDYLFTTLGPLLSRQVHSMGLRVLPVPFPIASAPMTLVTRSIRHDPYNAWLHETALAAVTASYPQ